MKIALIAALSTAVIAVGAAQAFNGGDDSPVAAKPAATKTEDRTTTTEDRHARRERRRERRHEAGEDVRREDRGVEPGDDRGGAQPTGTDARTDNSGPGSVNSGRGRGDDDRAEHEVEHGAENEVEHGAENEVEHGPETEAGDDHGGGSGHGGSGRPRASRMAQSSRPPRWRVARPGHHWLHGQAATSCR